MWRKLFAWMHRSERHLSALAMVAGFVADNLLFGRVDLWQTQAVFAAYTVVCFTCIPLLHWTESRVERGRPRPRWRSVLPILTQFSLGGFWSGFFVFYGRAAALPVSWPFMLLIVAMVIGNELLHHYHDRLVFSSVLFFFALYSYAIFAVPVFTHTMGTNTFLLSGAVAIALFAAFTVLLRIAGRTRFLADVTRIRVGAAAVFIVINLFYFTNILPPLPLSATAAGVYHAVWRVPGAYLATDESQSWAVRYLGAEPTLHVVPGESLYAYSAVFAPTDLTTIIVHRWQWRDPATGQWVTKAAISYPITGGRDGGYRGYSAVLMTEPGEWRVNVETVGGLLIARVPFRVVDVALPPSETTITLK
ncbi:MAG TPA: DUF2914 domain-containing protein [Candidatus Paceibacterota bacterium]|nr:DUF2914 domain-containing protein [Candidatus Paceibacterota bacterium]